MPGTGRPGSRAGMQPMGGKTINPVHTVCPSRIHVVIMILLCLPVYLYLCALRVYMYMYVHMSANVNHSILCVCVCLFLLVCYVCKVVGNSIRTVKPSQLLIM